MKKRLQPVVGDRAHVVVGESRPVERLELAQLVLVAALAAEAVDGAVAGGAHDPGARVVGQAVAWPALERDRPGLLHRLLGEVDVAEDPDQRRHRPPRLAPEQPVHDRRAAS